MNRRIFAISARRYFSNTSPFDDWTKALNCGIDKANFDAYLIEFLKYKKLPNGSSAGGSIDTYASVIGLNSDNEVVECHTLDEYSHQLALQLVRQNKLAQGQEIERRQSIKRVPQRGGR
ncbi:hypothetical protein [Chitiniphilus shinanonensis]|uniref:hypothetical protein n=1 Tax=Chitiniphilus shinanonensis TaxID=553088 RepID=UPI003052583F